MAMNEMENRRKIHEILDLVLLVNGLNERKKRLTGDRPTAFLRFSGHVALLETEIYASGWENGADATATFSFYTDREIPDEKIEMLRKVAQLAIMEDE